MIECEAFQSWIAEVAERSPWAAISSLDYCSPDHDEQDPSGPQVLVEMTTNELGVFDVDLGERNEIEKELLLVGWTIIALKRLLSPQALNQLQEADR